MPDFHFDVRRGSSHLEFDLQYVPESEKGLSKDTVCIGGVTYSLQAADPSKLSDIHKILSEAQQLSPSSPLHIGRFSEHLTDVDEITCTGKIKAIKEEKLSGKTEKPLNKGIQTALHVLKYVGDKLRTLAEIKPLNFVLSWFRPTLSPGSAEELFSQGKIHEALDNFEARLIKNPNDTSAKAALSEFGLSPGEWNAIKNQKAQQSDPFYGSKAKFSSLELQALKIISKIEMEKTPPSEQDKIVLRQFFAHISGNVDFNKRISLLRSSEPDVGDFRQWKFGSNTLTYLREYSYKSGNLNKLLKLGPKFKLVGELLGKKQEQLVQDKLTLADFRLADSFSNMSLAMNWMNSFRLWTEDSLMHKTQDAIEDLKFNLEKINERFDAEHQFDTGDIVLDTMKESSSYEGRSFNIANKVDWMLKIQGTVFRQKYVHAAVGLQSQHGYKMAEIDAQFQNPHVSFPRLCIAKVFRPNIRLLVSDRGIRQCRNLFKYHPELNHLDDDEKIMQYIGSQFKEIMHDFFSNPERFEKISNDQMRQITTVIKQHCQTKKIEPEDLDFESEQHMICSEFVGKVFVHCLDQLDKRLTGELRVALAHKYPKAKPEAIERLFRSGGLLKKPISQFENFSAMHVDRLFSLIGKYTEEVPPPEFISHILQES